MVYQLLLSAVVPRPLCQRLHLKGVLGHPPPPIRVTVSPANCFCPHPAALWPVVTARNGLPTACPTAGSRCCNRYANPPVGALPLKRVSAWAVVCLFLLSGLAHVPMAETCGLPRGTCPGRLQCKAFAPLCRSFGMQRVQGIRALRNSRAGTPPPASGRSRAVGSIGFRCLCCGSAATTNLL